MNMFFRIKRLFQEHKIIFSLALRNIKIKYKNTWLGFLWVLLQPLCTIGILYFVFSQVIRLDIEMFPLFLCAGVLPWTFFASALTEGTASIVSNSNLVLKVNFPREILPLTYCVSNVFDFVFALIILFIVLSGFAVIIPVSVLIWLIPLICIQFIFVFGLSMFLSVLHVFYKDIGHLLSVVLMFWFYLTPIFYSIEHVPEKFRQWYQYNPMTHFIGAYRSILFYAEVPSGILFVKISVISVTVFIAAVLFFISTEKQVAKEL